ncbi:MAG: YIEGIA domain-containing protein [Clostridia bacterium]|nr:YIEGIA domain-containing protein [Clostridia bacterium]
MLTTDPVVAIIFGLAVGLLERAYFLWADVRQYPTYPHNRIIHMFLGLIASLVGALAVPAILTKNFVAGVFLVAGAQQFHQVRTIERDMLASLDKAEIVPRGPAYVEAIAMGFEARNYMVLAAALVTSFSTSLWGWEVGLTIGLWAIVLTRYVLRAQKIESVAVVERVPVELTPQELRAGPIRLKLPEGAGLAPDRVRALRLTARRPQDRLVLSSPAQIQALVYEVASSSGVLSPDLEVARPQAKYDHESGSLYITYVPADPDFDDAEDAARHTLVLEVAGHRRRMARRRLSQGRGAPR